jgi:hypothetical protein
MNCLCMVQLKEQTMQPDLIGCKLEYQLNMAVNPWVRIIYIIIQIKNIQ